MKNSSRKRKVIKISIISLCSLAALAAILCISAYLLMHRYISKVNYVPLEEVETSQADLMNKEASDRKSDYLIESYGSSSGQAPQRSQDAVAASTAGSIQADQKKSDAETTAGSFNEDGMTASVSLDGEAVEDQETKESLEERIRKNISNASDQISKDKDILNLLLIGTDNRSEEEQGLSDAMILLSINQNTEKITAASLLRDIYLYIPEKNTFNRLNTAYAYGGARLLIKTIEENFKIKIDKYASVDFFSFIEVIDAIGGIELDITEEELPYVNALLNELNRIQGKDKETDHLKNSGIQLLNGRQALGYSRVRYVGTDFGRTARQRRVLEQIYKKIKKLGVKKTADLLDILLPRITTNFTEKELISQILSFPDYMEYKHDSFSIPMSGTYENLKIRGMQVLGIDFEKNVKELRMRIN